MSKRTLPGVEALEAKLALSAMSAHLGSAAMTHLAKVQTVHTEALEKAVSISGAYKIFGSATNPIVDLKADSFKLPSLGTVSIIGTESTKGGIANSAIVNTIVVYNGSKFAKISVTPGLFFTTGSSTGGDALTTTHTYTVLPNGKDGSGKLEMTLSSGSAFTMKFIPS